MRVIAAAYEHPVDGWYFNDDRQMDLHDHLRSLAEWWGLPKVELWHAQNPFQHAINNRAENHRRYPFEYTWP